MMTILPLAYECEPISSPYINTHIKNYYDLICLSYYMLSF